MLSILRLALLAASSLVLPAAGMDSASDLVSMMKATNEGRSLVLLHRSTSERSQEYLEAVEGFETEYDFEDVKFVAVDVSGEGEKIMLYYGVPDAPALLVFDYGRYLGKLPLLRDPDALFDMVSALDTVVYVLGDSGHMKAFLADRNNHGDTGTGWECKIGECRSTVKAERPTVKLLALSSASSPGLGQVLSTVAREFAFRGRVELGLVTDGAVSEEYFETSAYGAEAGKAGDSVVVVENAGVKDHLVWPFTENDLRAFALRNALALLPEYQAEDHAFFGELQELGRKVVVVYCRSDTEQGRAFRDTTVAAIAEQAKWRTRFSFTWTAAESASQESLDMVGVKRTIKRGTFRVLDFGAMEYYVPPRKKKQTRKMIAAFLGEVDAGQHQGIKIARGGGSSSGDSSDSKSEL